MEKLCSKCKELKDISFFTKDRSTKDGFYYCCKSCKSIAKRKYYLKNKDRLMNYQRDKRSEGKRKYIEYKKTLSCEKCGDSRWYVLEFHHRNKETKSFGIGKRVNTIGFDFELIKEEIEKCDVLCASCHKEVHYFFNNFS